MQFNQSQRAVIDELCFVLNLRFGLFHAARLLQNKHQNSVNDQNIKLAWPHRSLGFLSVKFNFTDIAIKLMNAKKFNFKERDTNGYNCLHWTVHNRNLTLAKRLIDYYPALREQDANGLTPLDLARNSNHINMFNVLIKEEREEKFSHQEEKSSSRFKQIVKYLNEKLNNPEIAGMLQEIVKMEEHFAKSNELDAIIIRQVNEFIQKVSEEPTRKEYRKRLFLGEGPFDGSNAVRKKHKQDHPTLGEYITATEYVSEAEAQATYANLTENLKQLKEAGTKVLFEVDATSLHAHSEISKENYPRIHFNCPHDKNNIRLRTLPVLMQNFFKSAGQIQHVGDRIYVTLPKPKDDRKRKFRQGYIYDIYNASVDASYRLKKKRKHGPERYPGYEHRITGRDESAEVAQDLREYIFEKTNLTPAEIRQKMPSVKYTAYGEQVDAFKEPNTESDSSEYVENDVENNFSFMPTPQSPTAEEIPQSPVPKSPARRILQDIKLNHENSPPHSPAKNVSENIIPPLSPKINIRKFFFRGNKTETSSKLSDVAHWLSAKENHSPMVPLRELFEIWTKPVSSDRNIRDLEETPSSPKLNL